MYGGVVYPRILDRLIPQLVGGGAGPAVGHPPLDDDADRRPRRSPSTSAATAWGEPPYNGATAYRPDFDHWLAGNGRGRRRAAALRRRRSTGLLRDRPAASSACAPTGPTATSRARVVIACDGVNSFLRQGGRALPATPTPTHYTLGVKETLALPEGGDRRALRRARPRGRRHRDRRLHRAASPAAGSSTPTSTRSPSASCSSCPSWPRQSAGPRRSSPGSSAHPAIAPLRRGRRAEGVLAPT